MPLSCWSGSVLPAALGMATPAADWARFIATWGDTVAWEVLGSNGGRCKGLSQALTDGGGGGDVVPENNQKYKEIL